ICPDPAKPEREPYVLPGFPLRRFAFGTAAPGGDFPFRTGTLPSSRIPCCYTSQLPQQLFLSPRRRGGAEKQGQEGNSFVEVFDVAGELPHTSRGSDER